MAKTAEEVWSFAESVLSPLGLEVLGAEYSKKYGELNLTILIGKDTPITLDDCERAHRAIDGPLDGFDPTDGAPYILNVSSFGLDRPLKRAEDFKRNIGRELEAVLFKAVEGKKKYVGFLRAFSPGHVVLEIDGAELTVERNNISKIKPYIRFE